MINTKKVYISIFITCIVYIISVFLTGRILGSELWYNLTNIEVDFFEILNNFMFYILSDLLGLAIIVYLITSFIKKVKTSDDEAVVVKNRINSLKKELATVTTTVLIIFTAGFFIEQVGHFNVLFVPFALIIILTATTFVVLIERYVLSK